MLCFMFVMKNTFIALLLIFIPLFQGCKKDNPEAKKLFEILKSGNNIERIEASEKLLEMGEAVEEELIKHLEENSENMRKSIIWILGEIGEKRYIHHIVKFIDAGPGLTRFSLVALGKIGKKSTIPVITKKLKDKSRYIRTDAVRALGRIGDKNVLSYLVEAKSDPDWHVREAAAISFGEVGGSEAIEHLKDMAENDPDSIVRIWADEGLLKNKLLK